MHEVRLPLRAALLALARERVGYCHADGSGLRPTRESLQALVLLLGLCPWVPTGLLASVRPEASREPGIEAWADPGSGLGALAGPGGAVAPGNPGPADASEAEANDGSGAEEGREPVASVPASPGTTGEAVPSDRLRIVINIPARKLRMYRGETRIWEVPVGIGRRHYPEEKGNTRTRVGSYRIVSWHDDYRSRQYPVPWSRDVWLGVFGPHTAKLGPRASYQYLHGTAGPEWMGTWLVEKDGPEVPPPGGSEPVDLSVLANAELGLSHGCVRLANTDIRELRRKAPVGTEVVKIYCLVERFSVPEGGTEDRYLPNVYLYRVPEPLGVFWPETGRLEGYRDPPDAVGPR